MKTVQRSPRHDGAGARWASAANSSRIEIPSRSACSSRKDPVPAAHALFIAKSTTTPRSIRMNLLSCPPISITVSTSGSIATAARAWAVISLRTVSAPTNWPTRWRPEPVAPAPRTSTRAPISCPIWASASRTASSGFPAVGR